MIRICTAIALALSLSFPVPGFAQSVIPGFGGTDLTINGVPGGANQVPGGLTLVPGTVAIPGVSGAANTGTIPLPGTTGAPGIPMIIDPVTNYPGNAGTGSSLYPPAYYPQLPTLSPAQSTLPQNWGGFGAPAIAAPQPTGLAPN